MDKKKIKNIVKYNKIVLFLYRFFGNFLIFLIKPFIKVNYKKILFMSFGGQKFDDSPKAIYDWVLNDDFFANYSFIWVFNNPNDFNIPKGKKIKNDSLKFYKEAISCGVWINNSSVQRGLRLKSKKTIEINTWHGTPLKKMGRDVAQNQSFTSYQKERGITVHCAQSTFDSKIWERFFNTTQQNIIISDLPRNDRLSHFEENEILDIRNKLNIPHEKKIILYAPTFREYDRKGSDGCYLNPPIDFLKWEKLLGNEYVILFRAHYEISVVNSTQSNSFFIDVSKYPTLNDLLIISDILISDYSSIFFDFSILERPMFCFAYDLDNYLKFRGLYEEPFSHMPSKIYLEEDSLLFDLKHINLGEMCQKAKDFRKEFAPISGNATTIVIEKIKDILNDFDCDNCKKKS